MKKTTPYPLEWPLGWPRTQRLRRRASRFGDHKLSRNFIDLKNEWRLMGADHEVLSTNVELRRDGIPYADAREPDDPGAAVYFVWRDRPYAIACDTYHRVGDNVRAIAKTLEAMRTIERHGASQLLERAMSGFAALPAGEDEDGHRSDACWTVLDIPQMDETKFADIARNRSHPLRDQVLKEAEAAYRAKVRAAHPDLGGSPETMRKLNDAIELVREALT